MAETSKGALGNPAQAPIDQFEKSPLKSKKFIAYLIADIGWTLLFVVMLVVYRESLTVLAWGLLMGTITVKGFVQVGMLLGQSSLDKFVRVARINASLGVTTPLPGESLQESPPWEGEETETNSD